MYEYEYDTMRAVEDRYWWYRGLRRLTADMISRDLSKALLKVWMPDAGPAAHWRI